MTVIVGPWQNSTQVRTPKDNHTHPKPIYLRSTEILPGIPEGDSRHNLTVDDLPLSVRPYNCLLNNNVLTVGDLIKKKRSDLLRNQNFGMKSLHEIEKILDGLGLDLAKERWGLEETEENGGAE